LSWSTPNKGKDEDMLIFGLVLFIGSLLGVMSLYVWAARDWRADAGTPPSYRRPVRHVPPRYLVIGGAGLLVG
jgi:hypothetical protein